MRGKGVRRLLDVYPDVPILGLSATNIRCLDNQRDMADELFIGNVISEMSLGEASGVFWGEQVKLLESIDIVWDIVAKVSNKRKVRREFERARV